MTHDVKAVRRGCPACVLAAFCLLLTGSNAWAQSRDVQAEIRGMIERMVQALRSLSYSGTLVYLHGSQLESLELSHVVQDGKELERLVSLNGAAREVRRDPKSVTCVMPDAKAVSVDQRGPVRPGLLTARNIDLQRIGGHYLLYPLGEFRVVDRPVQVLGIIPKDEFRYGYRFYLDHETGLPLKTDLMGLDAKPIEQIMFTSLTLSPEAAQPRAPAADREGYRRLLRGAPNTQAPGDTGPWDFQGLPAGFELHMHNHRRDSDGDRVDHFVLSDGLASVSVYLERDSGDGLMGPAHVGAMNAWGGMLQQYRVTAVGEVPEGTVRAVVDALHYVGERP